MQPSRNLAFTKTERKNDNALAAGQQWLIANKSAHNS
jgi:hypothetical protein